MRLEWSPHALADRDDIFDYIEAGSPRAAVAVDEAIATQVALLTEFPEAGRVGRVEGTRELVINRTPYIAACHVFDDTVRISAGHTWCADMARRFADLIAMAPEQGRTGDLGKAQLFGPNAERHRA